MNHTRANCSGRCEHCTCRSDAAVATHYVTISHLLAEKAFYEQVLGVLPALDSTTEEVRNGLYGRAVDGLERVAAALCCKLE